jgi:hypothetical protein
MPIVDILSIINTFFDYQVHFLLTRENEVWASQKYNYDAQSTIIYVSWQMLT